MILVPFLLLSVSIPAVASVTEGGAGARDSGFPPAVARAPAAVPAAAMPPVELAQMTIEQRVIIRVPMVRPGLPPPDMQRPRRRGDPLPPAPAPPQAMKWEERKGPKCVQLAQLRAAAITSSRGVDLMLRDASRLRAHLSRECRPEALYSGFYIQPDDDGSLCAGRDRLLARSGANCTITEFKRLVPDK
ncbi:hypothetical protein GGR43_000784 [Sphingobium jiangsuense]|uniref:UrcA family protein n=1 Tax=Sphingobium jiangsuense TaxID=870476 RepID=A0A7W6BE09_9SPHN|nr:hypothetical protein [Sphingobium jiangsuense]